MFDVLVIPLFAVGTGDLASLTDWLQNNAASKKQQSAGGSFISGSDHL